MMIICILPLPQAYQWDYYNAGCAYHDKSGVLPCKYRWWQQAKCQKVCSNKSARLEILSGPVVISNTCMVAQLPIDEAWDMYMILAIPPTSCKCASHKLKWRHWIKYSQPHHFRHWATDRSQHIADDSKISCVCSCDIWRLGSRNVCALPNRHRTLIPNRHLDVDTYRALRLSPS